MEGAHGKGMEGGHIEGGTHGREWRRDTWREEGRRDTWKEGHMKR